MQQLNILWSSVTNNNVSIHERILLFIETYLKSHVEAKFDLSIFSKDTLNMTEALYQDLLENKKTCVTDILETINARLLTVEYQLSILNDDAPNRLALENEFTNLHAAKLNYNQILDSLEQGQFVPVETDPDVDETLTVRDIIVLLNKRANEMTEDIPIFYGFILQKALELFRSEYEDIKEIKLSNSPRK